VKAWKLNVLDSLKDFRLACMDWDNLETVLIWREMAPENINASKIFSQL